MGVVVGRVLDTIHGMNLSLFSDEEDKSCSQLHLGVIVTQILSLPTISLTLGKSPNVTKPQVLHL